MTRTAAVVIAVLTATVAALAVAVVLLMQEQREQSQELFRLAECVRTLERNQGTVAGAPIMGCPID